MPDTIAVNLQGVHQTGSTPQGYWRRPLTNKGGLSIDPCVGGPKRRLALFGGD
jgi:hypothetical protein